MLIIIYILILQVLKRGNKPPNDYSDEKMFLRAEKVYYQVEDTDTYTVDYVREKWQQERGEWLPLIMSEGNWNAACNPTVEKVQQMAGAVRTALVLRMGMLKGQDYNIYYMFSSDSDWEKRVWKGNGNGYGMIDSDLRDSSTPSYNNPWYPYYVHEMIGKNLAVGDPIVETTPTSDDIRTLAWINDDKLNILLINKGK